MEKHVTQLDDEMWAASADAVEKNSWNAVELETPSVNRKRPGELTEARKCDVTANHEGRVEVEQFALVFQTVALFVVDNPEDRQDDGSE